MIYQDDKLHFKALLTPSFLSGTVAVMVGLLVTVGVILSFEFHNSVIQQQLESWEAKNQPTLTTPDQTLAENDHPGLKGTWPLLIIWCGIGLAVYAVTMAVVHFLTGAKQLTEEMTYVHVDRGRQLKDTAEHLVVRLVSLGVLAALTIILFKHVLPYSITDANASADDFLSFYGVVYAFLSWSSVTFTIYLQTVFLRLSLGKARVF
ncbi:MAG TPA: hypothetical protein VG604_03870 [Candidatus Saccharimonadales bacterium]|nr:hypothetical protein [Candidatus Saccharimonadales bacterium]